MSLRYPDRRHVTPDVRPSKAFPLLALFRVEILITVEAVQLAEIRRFVGGTIRGDKAIAVDKFPRGAALPGTMLAKLRVIITTRRPSGEIAQLLQAGDKQAGITDFIAIGHIVRASSVVCFASQFQRQRCRGQHRPCSPTALYCFTSSSVAEVS